jgi:hypothetical protein
VRAHPRFPPEAEAAFAQYMGWLRDGAGAIARDPRVQPGQGGDLDAAPASPPPPPQQQQQQPQQQGPWGGQSQHGGSHGPPGGWRGKLHPGKSTPRPVVPFLLKGHFAHKPVSKQPRGEGIKHRPWW